VKQPDFEPNRLTAVIKFEDYHRRICRYMFNRRYISTCVTGSRSLLRVSICPKVEAGPRGTLQIIVTPTHSYAALRRETWTSLLFAFYLSVKQEKMTKGGPALGRNRNPDLATNIPISLTH
jgi:hypothetical protein